MFPPLSNLLLVGIGGFFGVNARYILSGWVAARFSQFAGWPLPYGTIFVNVTGSFLLAVFSAWTLERFPLSDNVRLLVAVGFFGGYTTFSTFANESVAMLLVGNWSGGIGNIIITNLLCLLGVLAGIWLVHR